MKRRLSPNQRRGIFRENLTELVKNKGSISKVARDLDMARTQLSRFMDGSSFPKPCVLEKICDYFDVSPLIYSVPLSELSRDQLLPSGQSLTSPSAGLLPSGIYLEWSITRPVSDSVFMHFMQIKRDNGLCRMRVFARSPEGYFVKNTRALTCRDQVYIRKCEGLVFQQGNGISIIDGLPKTNLVAYSNFQIGHQGDMDLLPGYKIAGQSSLRGSASVPSRCVLQKIPQDSATILALTRRPQMVDWSDLNPKILSAFSSLAFQTRRLESKLSRGLEHARTDEKREFPPLYSQAN